MSVLGLIVEYNPFHNGHMYHLEESKKLSGVPYTVCVMSGNFIQRGEPAIINKWARAKMALLSGVDLVIELPLVYAMASAEFFAYGAVKILDSLGIVDTICFGSEHGKIRELDLIADLLVKEPENYKSLLKEYLYKGLSYPAAREQALISYSKSTGDCGLAVEGIIGSSNNILGIEYLKALKRLESTIVPLTIGRIANEYNSLELTGSISSATSIRNQFKKSTDKRPLSDIENTLPKESLSVLGEELKNGRGPVFSNHFENIILSVLRKASKEDVASLPFVSEGLENRIKHCAEISGTFDDLVENISTRRYTRTRVQRTLFNSLLGITAKEFETFFRYGGPQYIRVLGFNKKGRTLLSQINKKASLPVIIKAADFKNTCNPLLKRMLELEALSTDIYVLGYENPEYKKAGQEYTQNVVLLK